MLALLLGLAAILPSHQVAQNEAPISTPDRGAAALFGSGLHRARGLHRVHAVHALADVVLRCSGERLGRAGIGQHRRSEPAHRGAGRPALGPWVTHITRITEIPRGVLRL